MNEVAGSDDNVAQLRKLYAHFAKGEWEELTAMLSPDFVVVEADSLPYGGRQGGRDGLMNVIAGLGATYGDIGFTDPEIIGGKDSAVALFTFSAIAKATGRPIQMRFCEHWRFRDGLIILLEPFYFDTHAIVEAIKP